MNESESEQKVARASLVKILYGYSSIWSDYNVMGYEKKKVRKDRQIYGKSNHGTRNNV